MCPYAVSENKLRIKSQMQRVYIEMLPLNFENLLFWSKSIKFDSMNAVWIIKIKVNFNQELESFSCHIFKPKYNSLLS